MLRACLTSPAIYDELGEHAEVAELADALGSGPSELTMLVEVQVLSSALCRERGRVNETRPLFTCAAVGTT